MSAKMSWALLAVCGGLVMFSACDPSSAKDSVTSDSGAAGSAAASAMSSSNADAARSAGGTSSSDGSAGPPSGPADPSMCPGVSCVEIAPCPVNFQIGLPAGACCPGCVPADSSEPVVYDCTPEKVADCEPVACLPGYLPTQIGAECCDRCEPDPGYCVTDEDCVMADRPRPCCGCPEAVSLRLFESDECWYEADFTGQIPGPCIPDYFCNVVCEPCPEPGEARCVNNTCVAE